LAQDRFPASAEKRTTPLQKISPRAWGGGAGELKRVESRRSYLVNYARQVAGSSPMGYASSPVRSVDGCQHVAVECLTTALLKTLERAGERSAGRGLPLDLPLRLGDEVARGLRDDPWCRLIEPELQWLVNNDFQLTERKAEDICLVRIADTHRQVLEVLDALGRER
jgi:hypothetical protein